MAEELDAVVSMVLQSLTEFWRQSEAIAYIYIGFQLLCGHIWREELRCLRIFLDWYNIAHVWHLNSLVFGFSWRRSNIELLPLQWPCLLRLWFPPFPSFSGRRLRRGPLVSKLIGWYSSWLDWRFGLYIWVESRLDFDRRNCRVFFAKEFCLRRFWREWQTRVVQLLVGENWFYSYFLK